MKAWYILPFLLAAGAPGYAHAQATTALNPNLMTSWTGGAAVQDDLDQRAGRHHRRARADRSAQAAEGCGRLPEFRAKFGRRDPRVRKLTRLCRRAGH